MKPGLPDQSPGAVSDAFAAERRRIEQVLIEEKINSSIDEYLEEARARARVVVFDGE
ncbi:MAG: hypothetical protein IPF82_02595 [Blastocatellia bacterium]|nr:hypothetical protein [Blastocatellia bacterium]